MIFVGITIYGHHISTGGVGEDYLFQNGTDFHFQDNSDYKFN